MIRKIGTFPPPLPSSHRVFVEFPILNQLVARRIENEKSGCKFSYECVFSFSIYRVGTPNANIENRVRVSTILIVARINKKNCITRVELDEMG